MGIYDDDDAAAEWEDDPEGPQAVDLGDEDDNDDTVACSGCKRDISEHAEQCPHCGEWVIEDGESARRGWPVVVAVLVVIAGLLIWTIL